jgi:hypothetical protein
MNNIPSFWTWAGLALAGVIGLSFVNQKFAYWTAAILLLGGLVYIQKQRGGIALFLNELTNGAYQGDVNTGQGTF